MSERNLVGTDQDPIPTCKEFVRSVVLFVCVKCIKPLSFDSPGETDVVRRFPIFYVFFPTVFVFTSAGTRARDLPHGNRTL